MFKKENNYNDLVTESGLVISFNSLSLYFIITPTYYNLSYLFCINLSSFQNKSFTCCTQAIVCENYL